MTPLDASPPPLRPSDAVPGLSIGNLSAATGIGIETLRAWERRYGRPQPLRRASGHRRYGPDEVAWLRLVAEAVAAGARPSEVVPLTAPALRALVGDGRPAGPPDWLDFVARFDATALTRATVRARAAAPNAATFLDRTLSPFFAEIGTRWADGRLAIRHEHFATEVVTGVLGRLLELAPVPTRAPILLLTTLPNERHMLGLATASLVAAELGVRPRSLGPDTPPDEIAAAAVEVRAAMVAIAVSSAHGGPSTRRTLRVLRGALPAEIPMLVGGAGVVGPRRWPPGIVRCDSFEALARTLASFARLGVATTSPDATGTPARIVPKSPRKRRR